MGTRRNILDLPATDVQRLTNAFNMLKSNGTYDGFIQRHMNAMMTETPPGATSTDRNVAHRGPAFLPWHRATLLELTDALRSAGAFSATMDDLPYWKWEDEAARYGDPRNSPIWTNAYLGPDGDPTQGDRVLSGPFANWQALIYDSNTGTFVRRSSVGLIRRLGRDPQGMTTLPTSAQVTEVLGTTGSAGTTALTSGVGSLGSAGMAGLLALVAQAAPKPRPTKPPTPTPTATSTPTATATSTPPPTATSTPPPTSTPAPTATSTPPPTPTSTPPPTSTPTPTSIYDIYDVSPWDESSGSFRNRVEGWYRGSALHNQVHLYVGGDMLVGTSPNDPVFWLNHCNIDRLWWLWQQRHGINSYQPVSGGPTGHNLDDSLQFLLSSRTPRSVLDIGALGYAYS